MNKRLTKVCSRLSLLVLGCSNILIIFASTTQVSFTILPGTVNIGAPSSLTITAPGLASFTAQTLSQSFNTSATGYFFITDLQGADTGYSTTLQLSGMFTSVGASLSGGYVQFKSDGPVVAVMSGSANSNVIIDAAATGGYQSLNAAKTWIYRPTAANTGVIGQYGQYIDLLVNIPAAQPAGSYVGTLVYTFISN